MRFFFAKNGVKFCNNWESVLLRYEPVEQVKSGYFLDAKLRGLYATNETCSCPFDHDN